VEQRQSGGHNQAKSEITWRRFKEARSDCWCLSDAHQWVASWFCSTWVNSVCEDRLNKATDEAFVSVSTWCECLTVLWLVSMTGCHCGKAVGRDFPSCAIWDIMSHWNEYWDCAVDRSLGYHCHNHIHTLCSVLAHLTSADLTALLIVAFMCSGTLLCYDIVLYCVRLHLVCCFLNCEGKPTLR